MEEQPKKVLIVDDEKDLRDAMETALTYEGFEVHTAEDGVDGLLKAEALKPDLILLDILMPQKNGIDMLRELRQKEWGQMPVIIMSLLDDIGKIGEALDAGAQEYIVKAKISLSGIVEKVKSRLG